MQQVIQSEIGGLHKPDILERLIIKWLQKHNIKCSSPRRITRKSESYIKVALFFYALNALVYMVQLNRIKDQRKNLRDFHFMHII